MSSLSDLQLIYFRVERLFAEYCARIDEGELETWPELFVEDGCYQMIARENYEHGYPIPLVLLDNRGMMEDRVYSLRHANIFAAHRYRHAQSGVRITEQNEQVIRVSSSYIVARTLDNGETEVYQAGSYYDQLAEENGELKFKERLVVYDTSRIKTLLATPV
ncbi:MAG: aromatic-ring-hydroxylating dioxygenase subunit beta [Gammaproteobacteria bacterium]